MLHQLLLLELPLIFLPSYIKYSWTTVATYIYPPGRPNIVLPTDPSLTPNLLPSVDTKEISSPPPISTPPPDLRHTFRTFSLSLTLGLVSSSVTPIHTINLPTPAPN